MKVTEYSVYGTFQVTTEGDCEGRTTRDLGIYTGYIDEIAFALADKCYYKLCFTKVEPKKISMIPKRDKVEISLDINSGIWDLNNTGAMSYFKELFRERDVEVISVNGYGSCTLTTHKETIEEKRQKVLAKLSEEEKEVLGLK